MEDDSAESLSLSTSLGELGENGADDLFLTGDRNLKSVGLSDGLAFTAETESKTELKPLPNSVKKRFRRRPAVALFRLLFRAGIAGLAGWAAYGVSVGTNLPFWREAIGPELTEFARLTDEVLSRFGELIGLIM